ncbi:MarR family transcriptional regulator [Pelagibius litoralis]|uniref:MarR family transcriptional regulator n=1 Tax=Pelagibius litoralis TaxID=374515 RepID=A0A967KGX6_9PROT|nr:winged helix DNA-binding protein [Pelagibius litoralis]NIA70696.1 MarR family transcriptional regulator [Pelagibius litoralis]
MQSEFLDLIGLVERLHRQCLEMIKADLEVQGIRDLNSVQALILFNIGEEEFSVGELAQRGYYVGSNVSYNMRKMVENGYMVQERSPHDRRSFHVRASEKGLEVYHSISALFDRQIAQLEAIQPFEQGLDAANHALHRVHQLWITPTDSARKLSVA